MNPVCEILCQRKYNMLQIGGVDHTHIIDTENVHSFASDMKKWACEAWNCQVFYVLMHAQMRYACVVCNWWTLHVIMYTLIYLAYVKWGKGMWTYAELVNASKNQLQHISGQKRDEDKMTKNYKYCHIWL